VLPEEDFELGCSIHPSFPVSAVDEYEISGVNTLYLRAWSRLAKHRKIAGTFLASNNKCG